MYHLIAKTIAFVAMRKVDGRLSSKPVQRRFEDRGGEDTITIVVTNDGHRGRCERIAWRIMWGGRLHFLEFKRRGQITPGGRGKKAIGIADAPVLQDIDER